MHMKFFVHVPTDSVYQVSGSAKIRGQDSTSTEQSVIFLQLQVHL